MVLENGQLGGFREEYPGETGVSQKEVRNGSWLPPKWPLLFSLLWAFEKGTHLMQSGLKHYGIQG